MLPPRVALSLLRVRPQVVPEEQRQLFAKAPRPPDVDVRPPRPRRLAEVALCPVVVVGAEDVPQSLQGRAERLRRLQRRDRVCTSITGLAGSPGTAVEPMWSTRRATGPSARRSSAACAANRPGHTGTYSTTMMGSGMGPPRSRWPGSSLTGLRLMGRMAHPEAGMCADPRP
jgi:hypothetical protein